MTTKMKLTLQDVRNAFEVEGIYCRRVSSASLALCGVPGVVRIDQYGRAWFEVSSGLMLQAPRAYTDVTQLVASIVAYLDAINALD